MTSPQPPDLNRRTLTPFGYAVCIAVPVLIAALGLLALRLNYDEDDLVGGRSVPILTSDWEPGDGGDDALLSGELVLGEDGCVRVGDEIVVWPSGFAAGVDRVDDRDELKLYDGDHTIVARGGDTIEAGGGYGDASGYAGRTCAPDAGDVFLVQSEVRAVVG